MQKQKVILISVGAIIIIILAIIIISGVFVYKYFIIQTTADQTAGWKTYTNTQYGFEIKFPINEMISPNDIPDNVIEENFYHNPSYKEIIIGSLSAGCLLRIYPNIDDKFLSIIKSTDIKQLSILEHNGEKYFIGYNAPSSAIRVSDCILAFNKIIPTFKFTK